MNNINNKKIVWVVIGIIVLVGVFYVGVFYGKSQIPARGQRGTAQNFQSGIGATGGGFRNGGGFTAGQIISKDATSITVSVQGGGSKIIFLDSNTKITKSVGGAMADLAVGTNVSINGAANSDGSINAQSVQIRPNIAPSVVR